MPGPATAVMKKVCAEKRHSTIRQQLISRGRSYLLILLGTLLERPFSSTPYSLDLTPCAAICDPTDASPRRNSSRTAAARLGIRWANRKVSTVSSSSGESMICRRSSRERRRCPLLAFLMASSNRVNLGRLTKLHTYSFLSIGACVGSRDSRASCRNTAPGARPTGEQEPSVRRRGGARRRTAVSGCVVRQTH